MLRRVLFVVLALSAAFGAAVRARQFDCAKAVTPAEKLVCADRSLKALDDRLGQFYATALDAMEQSACLTQDERAWLADVRDRCATSTCLRDAYLARLGTLAGLQPGMGPARNADLPVVPQLRLFIPAVDRLEANIVKGAAAYEGRGTIGYVLDKGGFVLQTADGAVHALISDLAIQPETYRALDLLKTDKTPVIVRGRHGRLDPSTLAFDNQSCIAVLEVR